LHADGRLLRPRPVGEHPQLFRKQPYNLTGLDNHGSELVADYADTAFDVIDYQNLRVG
jgi:hypothetical protein